LSSTFAIPEYFQIGGDEGNTHSYRFHGPTALYVFLCRYHCDYGKLHDVQYKFGVDYSVFSKVFLTVLDYIDTRYTHLYNNRGAAAPRFAEFNHCIREKNLQVHGVCPPEANRVALFVDGTGVGIGRSKEYSVQREWYNWKYGHNAGMDSPHFYYDTHVLYKRIDSHTYTHTHTYIDTHTHTHTRTHTRTYTQDTCIYLIYLAVQ
jgi:hypothetical protein